MTSPHYDLALSREACIPCSVPGCGGQVTKTLVKSTPRMNVFNVTCNRGGDACLEYEGERLKRASITDEPVYPAVCLACGGEIHGGEEWTAYGHLRCLNDPRATTLVHAFGTQPFRAKCGWGFGTLSAHHDDVTCLQCKKMLEGT